MGCIGFVRCKIGMVFVQPPSHGNKSSFGLFQSELLVLPKLVRSGLHGQVDTIIGVIRLLTRH